MALSDRIHIKQLQARLAQIEARLAALEVVRPLGNGDPSPRYTAVSEGFGRYVVHCDGEYVDLVGDCPTKDGGTRFFTKDGATETVHDMNAGG
jgi:hypothetical protein